jgi:hypothetical protein
MQFLEGCRFNGMSNVLNCQRNLHQIMIDSIEINDDNVASKSPDLSSIAATVSGCTNFWNLSRELGYL